MEDSQLGLRITNIFGSCAIRIKSNRPPAHMGDPAEPYTYRLSFSTLDHWEKDIVPAEEVEPIFAKLKTARIAPLAPGPYLLDVTYHEFFIHYGGTSVTYHWSSMQEKGWGALYKVASLVLDLGRKYNPIFFDELRWSRRDPGMEIPA